jgi:hypothetical protein
VNETTVKRHLRCGFRRTGKAMGQVYQRLNFFLICVVGAGIKVHSTVRPLNGLLCQPRVIMIMGKSVE